MHQYTSRILEVEQATVTPLVFSTTGGIEVECKRYHCWLAELVATKKVEIYVTTMSWIRARVSSALLRSANVTMLENYASWDEDPSRIVWHWLWYQERACEYSLKTLRTIFYSLVLFIIFLGRFPYLKLISYILLSYFCYLNVDSRGLKFSCKKHNF